MYKIVLYIDSGNSYFKKAEKYLSTHGCKVYVLPAEELDMGDLLDKIDKKEGKIDFLLFGVDEEMPEDGVIGDKHDYESLLKTISSRINRMQSAIEASLPLLRKGELKRIGMLTKKESSIGYCRNDRNYAQYMTWAGLNMVGKLYFNRLRPEGFRFRWYCAEENSGGMSAGEYLLSNLCYDDKEPYMHSDENRLVMRDAFLREVAW